MTYYTNGINERRFNDFDIIPNGWYKGRVKMPSGTTGYKWYTNGIDNISLPNNVSIPDGYNLGRTLLKTSIDKQKKTKSLNKNHWYNDGETELSIPQNGEIPLGFVPGRLPISNEQKIKLSTSHIGKHHSKETKLKISNHSNNNREKAKQTCLEKYGVGSVFAVKSIREKAVETKRVNNTLNSSSPEKQYYKTLCEQYGSCNVKKHYKSDEYPFYCDFYIVPEKKFIELNLHWTHGGMPFNPNDEDCIKQLNEWQEKAKTSQYYANAIETWTVRDVKKLQVAKDNNLNYNSIYRL